MLVVGDNLLALITQYGIISDKRCFDNTSLSLSLDRELVYVEPDVDSEITYGHRIPDNWVKKAEIPDKGFVLPPRSAVLGCSVESVKIPLGYYGFLQTKGSLARLFVFIHCCDGQIDAGYHGKITFEMVNMSNLNIRFLPYQKVAQLFIFKTSTNVVEPYNGRYQGATGPTVQLPGNL